MRRGQTEGRTMKSAQGRAQSTPLRRDGTGYDPFYILQATRVADQDQIDPAASDAVFHLVASGHTPEMNLPRFVCPFKNGSSDIRRQVGGLYVGPDGNLMHAEGMQIPLGTVPDFVKNNLRESFRKLNAQGRQVVTERLVKIGHRLDEMGIADLVGINVDESDLPAA